MSEEEKGMSNQLRGDEGEYKVLSKFSEFGCKSGKICADVGEDGLENIFRNGIDEHLIFFHQVKTVESLGEPSKQNNSYSVSIKKKHFERWLDLRDPVFLILHDKKKNKSYWQLIQRRSSSSRVGRDTSKETITIYVPAKNLLNSRGYKHIVKIVRDFEKNKTRMSRELAAQHATSDTDNIEGWGTWLTSTEFGVRIEREVVEQIMELDFAKDLLEAGYGENQIIYGLLQKTLDLILDSSDS